jgi:hypothetical protein
MKQLVVIPAALACVALLGWFGWFLLAHIVDIFSIGELTYGRRGHPRVTVSPDKHAFSYFFQLSYLTSLGACLLLFVASMLSYAFAKLLRVIAGNDSRSGAIAYAAGTNVAIGAGVFFVVWFALHCIRYWVVA